MGEVSNQSHVIGGGGSLGLGFGEGPPGGEPGHREERREVEKGATERRRGGLFPAVVEGFSRGREENGDGRRSNILANLIRISLR